MALLFGFLLFLIPLTLHEHVPTTHMSGNSGLGFSFKVRLFLQDAKSQTHLACFLECFRHTIFTVLSDTFFGVVFDLASLLALRGSSSLFFVVFCIGRRGSL